MKLAKSPGPGSKKEDGEIRGQLCLNQCHKMRRRVMRAEVAGVRIVEGCKCVRCHVCLASALLQRAVMGSGCILQRANGACWAWPVLVRAHAGKLRRHGCGVSPTRPDACQGSPCGFVHLLHGFGLRVWAAIDARAFASMARERSSEGGRRLWFSGM